MRLRAASAWRNTQSLCGLQRKHEISTSRTRTSSKVVSLSSGLVSETYSTGKGKRMSRERATANCKPKRCLTVWLTGLSGAGKTTLCRYVQIKLATGDMAVEVLHGDVVRAHLCKAPGHSEADRKENIRRIAHVAKMLTHHRKIVLVAAISSCRCGREEARSIIGNFIEVYVNAPLVVCEQRDPKGLYECAEGGWQLPMQLVRINGLGNRRPVPALGFAWLRQTSPELSWSERRAPE